MRLVARVAIAALSACFSTSALAYDATVHVTLSAQAADRSVLAGDPSLLVDLGLSPYVNPVYQNRDGVDFQTVQLLIAFGAVREDDWSWTGLRRPVNHFYDPQFNNFQGRGLGGFTGGRPSPNWALEDVGEQNNGSGSNFQQLYSYNEATKNIRHAMLSPSRETRTQAAARVFETLGQVIHHLQDMGQPQHTRHETHPPVDPDSAAFENYTRDVLSPQLHVKLGEWPSYAVPTFPTARHFWYTPGVTSPTYVGMAEYSAQNFLTTDTHFRVLSTAPPGFASRTEFPRPNGSNLSVNSEHTSIPLPNGGAYSGQMKFIVGTVQDDLSGTLTNGVKLGTFSLVPGLGEASTLGPEYHTGVAAMNPTVYEAQYPLLLPRAIAFSAGLINHFFRGRLAFSRNPGGSGWVVRNLSNQPMVGALEVFSENSSLTRALVPGALFAVDLDPNESTIINFTEPAPSTKKLIVFFSGQLGAETRPSGMTKEGWAAKVINFSPLPVSCGVSISASGSEEGVTIPHDLGTTPGPVQVEFEAYVIPDGLEVRANNPANSLLAHSGGQTSGYHLYEFPFDPTTLGTSIVTLRVIANVNPDTQWTTTLGCPGQDLSNEDRDVPMRLVRFVFGGATSSAGTCSFDLFVDGVSRGNITAGFNSPSVYLNMLQGTHGYEYRNKVCVAEIGNSYPAYYTDPTGNYPLLNPFYSGISQGTMVVH